MNNVHKTTTNIRMTRKSILEDIQRLMKIEEVVENEEVKELIKDWKEELYKIYQK